MELPNESFLRVLRETIIQLKSLGHIGISEIPAPSEPKSKSQDVQNASKQQLMARLKHDLVDCQLCKLCKGRTKIVFGEGNLDAELFFVGEGPGANEDEQGLPFVGQAGQLLTKIIQAIGFKREDVYIANVVKCRPPQNRDPEPDEIQTCMAFLIRQIHIIQPKIIIALGKHAAQALLNVSTPISKLRGKFHEFNGIPLMPTYHPAMLLYNPGKKRDVWEDMKQVHGKYYQLMGKVPPKL